MGNNNLKKKKKLQEEAKENFYKKGRELGTSDNMLNYCWDQCVKPQLGYSFNKGHLIAYSLIALQEMNLYYHYPSVYWQTACLIVDSGSDEQHEGESTDYGKIAVAISNLQQQGIKIARPDINTSSFGFKPDVANNEILYALKAINGVGDNLAKSIIAHRPYTSYEDFIQKVNPQNSELVALIKAGCFINIEHAQPENTMLKFLDANTTLVEKLTLAQINRCVEYGIITEDSEIYHNYRMINFKKYVLDDKRLYKIVIDPNKKIPKCGYHDRLFRLDSASQPFFEVNYSEDSIVSTDGQYYVISEKLFTKEVKAKYLDPLSEWLNDESVIRKYNTALRQETYNHYVKTGVMHWTFDALSMYYTHELSVIEDTEYGIVNFYDMPEEPEPYDYVIRYGKGGTQIPYPKYKITRVCGTVVDSDNDKHIVTLLTEYGIVKVKFNKGQYQFYNRRAKEHPSWFKRGTLLLVAGFRDGDIWRAKVYGDSIYKHTVNKIVEITNENQLVVLEERVFDED